MNVKGGRFINKGMKGFVYEIRDLIKDFNFGIEEIVLMGINDNGKSKKIVLRDDNEILWIIKELKKVEKQVDHSLKGEKAKYKFPKQKDDDLTVKFK